jgi:hypothetical protein
MRFHRDDLEIERDLRPSPKGTTKRTKSSRRSLRRKGK